MTLHMLNSLNRIYNERPDEPEPDSHPVEPDEGPIQPAIPEDPEHDRTIDPAD